MYSLETTDNVYKLFKKLGRKDPNQAEAVEKKVQEILKNPQKFKPLKSPMQHMRRVHVGHFVMVYDVDEQRKVVTVRKYEHHDEVYKK